MALPVSMVVFKLGNLLVILQYLLITYSFVFVLLGEKVAIKAMQKSRISDYEAF